MKKYDVNDEIQEFKIIDESEAYEAGYGTAVDSSGMVYGVRIFYTNQKGNLFQIYNTFLNSKKNFTKI